MPSNTELIPIESQAPVHPPEHTSHCFFCVDIVRRIIQICTQVDKICHSKEINAEEAYHQVDAFDSARSQLLGFNQEGQGMGVLRAEQFNPDTEYKEYLELARLASPISFVTTDDCPIFIANGGKDGRVAVAQAEKLHKLYIQAGLESYLMVNSKAGHGNLGTYVNDAALSFLRDKLGMTE